jgi:hypothetical protein
VAPALGVGLSNKAHGSFRNRRMCLTIITKAGEDEGTMMQFRVSSSAVKMRDVDVPRVM